MMTFLERVKEKISEGVDLGYSNIEVKDPTPDKVEEINSKIEDVYYESENFFTAFRIRDKGAGLNSSLNHSGRYRGTYEPSRTQRPFKSSSQSSSS